MLDATHDDNHGGTAGLVENDVLPSLIVVRMIEHRAAFRAQLLVTGMRETRRKLGA